ncbi:MAG: hypothetical protein N3C13_02615, partial [Aquificaceae bacterium]|nr:hypothetical protein [Aquificaceae bacterium]
MCIRDSYLISTMPVRHPSQRRELPEELPEESPSYACPFYSRCSKRLKECEEEVKEVKVDGRIV